MGRVHNARPLRPVMRALCIVVLAVAHAAGLSPAQLRLPLLRPKNQVATQNHPAAPRPCRDTKFLSRPKCPSLSPNPVANSSRQPFSFPPLKHLCRAHQNPVTRAAALSCAPARGPEHSPGLSCMQAHYPACTVETGGSPVTTKT